MTSNSVNERMSLFPATARIEAGARGSALTIAGSDLTALAERYGTPLYIYDQTTLDTALSAYRNALWQSYPGDATITYAGKAFLCTAVAQWVKKRGLWLDCSSAGEVGIAAAAGLGQESILLHGVGKTAADLSMGLRRAGIIVVDSLSELAILTSLAECHEELAPDLWLRIRPNLSVDTHPHIQTGHSESKFGMDMEDAIEAIQLCRKAALNLTGLHFHLGSQLRALAPLAEALDGMGSVVATLFATTGWLPRVVCPGGGLGCTYREDEPEFPSIEEYVSLVAQQLATSWRQHGLELPELRLEPGRSLIARAGVALYKVVAVKQHGGRRWLVLDGGLADNPRPALYGARYTALPVVKPDRPLAGIFWLAGPFCESSDVLIEALPLPEVEAGEVLAVPASGAYQLAMASNYNGARKPAVIWLGNDGPHLIQRRETAADLLCRDTILACL